MRKHIRPWTIVFMVVLAAGAFAALAVAQEAESGAKTVTVVGTIVAADWDENGAVVAVNLQSDEDEYVIADTETAAELLHLVGQKVSVTGTVAESEEGSLVLTVSSFSVVKESQ
jgi:hypothetical protein